MVLLSTSNFSFINYSGHIFWPIYCWPSFLFSFLKKVFSFYMLQIFCSVSCFSFKSIITFSCSHNISVFKKRLWLLCQISTTSRFKKSSPIISSTCMFLFYILHLNILFRLCLLQCKHCFFFLCSFMSSEVSFSQVGTLRCRAEPTGQALPGSVHATHDGGGVVAASTVLNMQFPLPLGWPVLNSIYRATHVFSPGLTFLCAKFLEILDLIKFIYFLSWSLPKSVAYYFNYQS